MNSIAREALPKQTEQKYRCLPPRRMAIVNTDSLLLREKAIMGMEGRAGTFLKQEAPVIMEGVGGCCHGFGLGKCSPYLNTRDPPFLLSTAVDL